MFLILMIIVKSLELLKILNNYIKILNNYIKIFEKFK